MPPRLCVLEGLQRRSRPTKNREMHPHRNKGTWRDMRSALISFARSLSLTGDGAGGFPSAFALNGSACARINMLDRFDLSDEKLRDALDSSPWSRFVKHRRSQRLPSAKKAGHIKSMPVRLRLHMPLLDEPRPL